MKKKLLLFIVLLVSLNGLAQKTSGGQVNVRLFIDYNCNKNADDNENINTGFTVTLTGGKYNKTMQTLTRDALFTELAFGTYNASVSYSYTNPSGVTATLNGSSSATINSEGVTQISILLNPCNMNSEKIDNCGQWEDAKILARSILDISGNNDLNNNKSLIVNKLNTVLSFNGTYNGTVAGKNQNCAITGNIVYPDNTTTEWANSFTLTTSKKGIYTINYYVKCGNKNCESGSKQIINNNEEETPLPKDLCGQWQNNTIVASLNGRTVGEYNINTKNNFDVALLNTELSFDGVYKWTFEKRTGKCRITGTIVEPDGNKINWTNNFYIKVRKPGAYTITYQIKCVESICESNVKVFTCNDAIVCNCAPQQDDFITNRSNDRKGTVSIFKNGDSILMEKKFKANFDYNVRCEGNVCDAVKSFQLTNALNQVVSTNESGYINMRLPNGNYTLQVKGYCGGKNCTTLNFPVRIYGEDKRKQKADDVHARWGNQIGVNFGWPQFDKLIRDKMYTGFMFGTIADLPFGYYKRWHFWPAINLATAKYTGTQQLPIPVGATVNVEHKQLRARLGADLSYAIPVGKKDAKFHFYVGLSVDGAIIQKSTYTGNPTSVINPWLIANKSDSTEKLSLNFNAGILFDINKTFTLGANYYSYNIQAHKKMFTTLVDRGLSLRLAWFYNQKQHGIRR
jgi:hypothetical protein